MHLQFVTASGLVSLVALLAGVRSTAAQYDSQAFAASPFGVAHVSVPLDDEARQMLASDGLQIRSAEGRVFYPVFSQGTARRFLAEISGQAVATQPKQVDVFFLFRGDAPLDIVVETSRAHRITVKPATPRSPPRGPAAVAVLVAGI